MERRSGADRTRPIWAAIKEAARVEVSRLDHQLQDLFGKRLDQVGYIGKAKTHLGEEIIDPKRRDKVIQDWEERFRKRGFQPGAGTRIAKTMLEVFEDEQQVSRDRGDYRPRK